MAPLFPGGGKICGPEETTLYNITADTYRYAFLSDKSRTSRGNVGNFERGGGGAGGETVATRIFDALQPGHGAHLRLARGFTSAFLRPFAFHRTDTGRA